MVSQYKYDKLKKRIESLEIENRSILQENKALEEQISYYEDEIDTLSGLREQYFDGIEEAKRMREKYKTSIREAMEVKKQFSKEFKKQLKQITK